MIDADGYRPNVGIILSNFNGEVLWARRIGQNAWQFPQGGICAGETPEQAMYRELSEELGLSPAHVDVLACTQGWLRYRLPKRLVRRSNQQVCIGQKQVWFMLRFVGADHEVRLDCCAEPEFDSWRWVDYWYPLDKVVSFKRKVYACALKHFEPLMCNGISAEPQTVSTRVSIIDAS